MSIGAAQIRQVITMARTAFPTRCVTLKWNNQQDSVTALRGSLDVDDTGDIDGVIEGARSQLYIIGSECGDMGIPGSGDQVWIDDVEHALLGHFDYDAEDPPTVRKLMYGEAGA